MVQLDFCSAILKSEKSSSWTFGPKPLDYSAELLRAAMGTRTGTRILPAALPGPEPVGRAGDGDHPAQQLAAAVRPPGVQPCAGPGVGKKYLIFYPGMFYRSGQKGRLVDCLKKKTVESSFPTGRVVTGPKKQSCNPDPAPRLRRSSRGRTS